MILKRNPKKSKKVRSWWCRKRSLQVVCFVLFVFPPYNGGPISPAPLCISLCISLAPGFLLLMFKVIPLPVAVGLYSTNKGNKANGSRVILLIMSYSRESLWKRKIEGTKIKGITVGIMSKKTVGRNWIKDTGSVRALEREVINFKSADTNIYSSRKRAVRNSVRKLLRATLYNYLIVAMHPY